SCIDYLIGSLAAAGFLSYRLRCMPYTIKNVILELNTIAMTELTIEHNVNQKIEWMQQQGLDPVAVMLGHEDWLNFTVQSKVAYTPFGSARRYQPALAGLLLVRVDEMQAVRVVTQDELDAYAQSHQIL